MREELEHSDVAGLLQTLPRVDAPGDFDFKVKARISAGRPAASRRFPLWVGAAIPALLLIAVIGYFGLRTSKTTLEPANPVVATVEPQTSQPVQPPVLNEAVPAQPTQVAAADPKPSNPALADGKKRAVRREPQGGSIDSAANIERQITLTERSATEVLSEIGVRGTFDARGMKVDSADEKRSGLKTGDVIETIDGQAVGSGSTVKGRLAGKRLRVLRDGKSVDVVVKN